MLALPEHGTVLSSDWVAHLADEAGSLNVTGKLRDRSNTAAWPPLSVTLEVRRDKGALVIAGGAETSERTLVAQRSARPRERPRVGHDPFSPRHVQAKWAAADRPVPDRWRRVAIFALAVGTDMITSLSIS